MFDLTGKTALVTGATGGLGARHRARRCTRRARPSTLSGTRAGGARRSWRAELGVRASHVIPCDLSATRPRRRKALVPGRRGGDGRQLDILVNNAGLTRDGLMHAHEGRGLGHASSRSISRRRFRLCAIGAVKGMMKRRRYGRIIGVYLRSSASRAIAGQANYCAVQGRHDRHDQGAGGGGRLAATSPPTASRRASSRAR